MCGTLFIFMAGGGLLLYVLIRRVERDSLLMRVIMGSYALHVVLMIAMFCISLWKLPILQSQQAGKGFWLFGLDSWTYHLYGARIADAWEHGFELPDPGLNIAYLFVVGFLYRLFGPYPLFAALLNCSLSALTALLAYLIGKRLFNHQAGLISAAVVGFWPSSLLWSTQLLKDSLAWFLCFSTLWLLLELIPEEQRSELPEPTRWVFRSVMLGVVVSGLTLLRAYMGSMISLATIIVGIPAAGYALMQRRFKRVMQYLSVVGVVVAFVLMARTWDLFRWLSPPHPDVGHFRAAMRCWQREELLQAAGEFYRALQLNPAYKEAYEGLGVVLIEEGRTAQAHHHYDEAAHRYDQAVKVYTSFLSYVHDPEERLTTQHLIGSIYLEVARSWLVSKSSTAAQGVEEACQRGIELHPSLASACADLRSIIEPRRSDVLAVIEPPKPNNELVVATVKDHSPLLQTTVREPRPRAAPQKTDEPLSLVRDPIPVPPPSLLGSGPPHRSPPEADAPQRLSAVTTAQSERTETLDSLIQHLPDLETRDLTMAKRTKGSDNLFQSVAQLDDEVLVVAHEMTVESLGSRRQGFVNSGGYSVMDAWAKISTPKGMITYLPRALLIGFLAPFPTRWFDTKGSTGIMRTWASIDMLLFYLLLPGLLVGGWELLKRRRSDGILLLTFTLLTATAMSLVVANLGTLFRLRLQFLLPMLIVAAGGVPRVLERIRPRSKTAGLSVTEDDRTLSVTEPMPQLSAVSVEKTS